MNISNNLFIVIFALLPIILYVYLVYYMIPKTYVSLDRGRRYLISGLMSPFLVFLVYFIFPNWGKSITDDFFLSYCFFAIVQIGLLEEFCKYTIFQWVSTERLSQKYDLPVATMYYSFMTALGFALTENISYLISLYQSNSLDPTVSQAQLNNSMLAMALTRSLTAVVMHMICGIIIGYFTTLSIEKEKTNKLKKINENHHNLNLFNKIYLFYGISLAALFHGIYDLNLMLPDNNYKMFFCILIIAFGLSIGYFMITDLIKKSKIQRTLKLNQNESS